MRRFPLTITKTAGKKLLEIANQNKCDKLLFYVVRHFRYKIFYFCTKMKNVFKIIIKKSIIEYHGNLSITTVAQKCI